MVAQRTTLISYDNICRDIFLLFEDTRVQIQRCIGMHEIVLSNNFSEQHRFRAWRARGKRKLNMSRSTCRNKKANWLFKPISRGDMAIAGNSFQWNDRISPHFYDYGIEKMTKKRTHVRFPLCRAVPVWKSKNSGWHRCGISSGLMSNASIKRSSSGYDEYRYPSSKWLSARPASFEWRRRCGDLCSHRANFYPALLGM